LYNHSHEAISSEISGISYTDEQLQIPCVPVAKTRLSARSAWRLGYQALKDMLEPGETGIFLETAHPAKFLDTVQDILGEKIEIPQKLQEFMKGEKQSIAMSKDFEDFKRYLMEK
jgi:threonine synthase